MAAKKSNKQRKWGRHSRKPCGGKNQAQRTYHNKLKRINLEREKAGIPILAALAPTSTAYQKAYKVKP